VRILVQNDGPSIRIVGEELSMDKETDNYKQQFEHDKNLCQDGAKEDKNMC
jgi:hypothetical protein